MTQVGGVPAHAPGHTHLANAASLEGPAQGVGLLAVSTCSWDYAWAAAWLPLSATSLPITELGRFPPNRTFAHCTKGARPRGLLV